MQDAELLMQLGGAAAVPGLRSRPEARPFAEPVPRTPSQRHDCEVPVVVAPGADITLVRTPTPQEVVNAALEEAAASMAALATSVPDPKSEIVNRGVNIMLALIALVILAPIMIVIAALVVLTSRGPAIYAQVRVGMDRRRRPTEAVFDRRKRDGGGVGFTIYKFRSMAVEAEAAGHAVWAKPNDPRVTPVGRILRKTRLDELPQLFNVLKGDMNIVGPRPERPSIFADLRRDIAGYQLRQRTRPGITGWAQINQAYDACIDDVRSKVRYDLEYLHRRSVTEDLRIMLRTLPVMLFNKGGW